MIVLVLALITMIVVIYWGIVENRKRAGAQLYHNEMFVIIGSNESSPGVSSDKYHKPIAAKVWLIQRVNNINEFAELSSTDGSYGFRISNDLWYTKGIGDTLYFKYIRKDRFFTIKLR